MVTCVTVWKMYFHSGPKLIILLCSLVKKHKKATKQPVQAAKMCFLYVQFSSKYDKLLPYCKWWRAGQGLGMRPNDHLHHTQIIAYSSNWTKFQISEHNPVSCNKKSHSWTLEGLDTRRLNLLLTNLISTLSWRHRSNSASYIMSKEMASYNKSIYI